MIGVKRRQTKFDGKDKVDEADKEEVGVERRLEDEKCCFNFSYFWGMLAGLC